jgi:hypothetical protein
VIAPLLERFVGHHDIDIYFFKLLLVVLGLEESCGTIAMVNNGCWFIFLFYYFYYYLGSG